MENFDIEKIISGDNRDDVLSDKQWKILNAAIKVFSEKGFDASRTSEIAKEAEVAEGTIFRYFPTKKKLLESMIIPLIIKFINPLLVKSVEKIMTDGTIDIETQFKEIYYDRLQLFKKNSKLLKTVFFEASKHPELLTPIKEKLFPAIYKIVENFIEEKKSIGIINNDLPTYHIVRVMFSQLLGYILLSELFSDFFKKNSDEEDMALLAKTLLYGIIDEEVKNHE